MQSFDHYSPFARLKTDSPLYLATITEKMAKTTSEMSSNENEVDR